MANVYPTHVQFLIADGVRQEQGSKLTVLGFYAGNSILLNEPLPSVIPDGFKGIAIPSVTMIVNILDGQGLFKCSVEVFRPSGKVIGKGLELQVEKKKDAAATLLVPMQPFPVSEFGIYRTVLKLNTRKYEFKFKVGHTNPRAQLPVEPIGKAPAKAKAPQKRIAKKTTSKLPKAGKATAANRGAHRQRITARVPK